MILSLMVSYVLTKHKSYSSAGGIDYLVGYFLDLERFQSIQLLKWWDERGFISIDQSSEG